MTKEELAFVNQQLAGMLQAGLPLEGALERVCRDLRGGGMKVELEALREDLVRGEPVVEAVRRRRLPELYRNLVEVGVRGGDLPGMLTLLADYYQRGHVLWLRLKGLMVYPVLVLAGCALVAGFIAWIFGVIGSGSRNPLEELLGGGVRMATIRGDILRLWAPAFGFGLMAAAVVVVLLVPRMRSWLRWRAPGFKEGALANLAMAFYLLLSRGCSLRDAVALVGRLEGGSPAGRELEEWARKIEGGEGKPLQFASEGRVLPPLFRWVICQGGQDLAAGFKRAADLYHARAVYRSDMLLNLALPLSVMVLGLLMLAQFYPLMRLLAVQLDMLGSFDM
ncbi:MAG: type II secretion system F family protein [Limisphaerales bacterium]